MFGKCIVRQGVLQGGRNADYFHLRMIYLSDHVVPMCGDVIKDGAVAVRDGKIAAVGTRQDVSAKKGEKVRNLAQLVLMPGLINCHTHLEEGVLRSDLDHPSGFASWYAKSSKYFGDADLARRIQAVRLGARESLYYGTTTLSDTASTGASFLVLREERLRSLQFLQFKSMVPWQAKAVFSDAQVRLDLMRDVMPPERMGLAPHAPYTTSQELYRYAIKSSRMGRMLFQTHLAESNEELEMFSSHTGPLFEFSQRQHETDLRDYTRGPASFMLMNNLIPTRSLVLHGNYLSSEEFEALTRRKASLVHCAQSHVLFGHKDFPFEAALSRGVCVCLGTESLASAETLSLFDDMHIIKQRHPDLESRTILQFATVNGAMALGMHEKVGCIRPGREADLIGLRISGDNPANLYDEIVLGDPQVEFVMVGGEEVVA